MKRWRWLLGFALAGLILVAAYMAGTSQQARTDATDAGQAEAAAYDYEANGVTVRQMDADGKLQYQIDAERVAQLPSDGAIDAQKLTMHYDPRGTAAGGARRWTLTADAAHLPENSDIVQLSGKVLVRGRPGDSPMQASLATERLDYNLSTQDLSSTAAVELRWGGNEVRGRGLRANIKDGTVALESSVNGKILP